MLDRGWPWVVDEGLGDSGRVGGWAMMHVGQWLVVVNCTCQF